MLAPNCRSKEPASDPKPDVVPSTAEKSDTSAKVGGALIDRIVSTGGAWKVEAQRVIKTDASVGDKATGCVADALSHLRSGKGSISQQHLKVCLYMLQLLSVDKSIPLLDQLAMSKSARDSIRVETLVAMCNQRQGIHAVEQKLAEDDDRTRASAVFALARVQDIDKIKNMLSDLRQRKTDFTGTYTGSAMAEAQSKIDLSQALPSMTFDEQMAFMLANLPYEQAPPPAPHQLASDPASIFEFNYLISLWKQDAPRVRQAAEKFITANPGKREVVELLLSDLSTNAASEVTP
jgi:hypothetical protein